ncbi:hypothetical protein L1887_43910 [Cichorium endivia]|nr:hypothetical protein L1887_43910 [Cichorium endivia]
MDEHPIVRMSIEVLLQKNKNITVKLKSGDSHEVLDCIRNHPIDLVILDIELTGTDAFALLKRIRNLNKNIKNRISLRINRDRPAGLLKRQPRFIRIPDLNGDMACCTGVIQRQQAAIAPVGFTRKRNGRRARRAAGQLQRKRHRLRAAPGGAELFRGPGAQRDGLVAVAALGNAGKIDDIAVKPNVNLAQGSVRLSLCAKRKERHGDKTDPVSHIGSLVVIHAQIPARGEAPFRWLIARHAHRPDPDPHLRLRAVVKAERNFARQVVGRQRRPALVGNDESHVRVIRHQHIIRDFFRLDAHHAFRLVTHARLAEQRGADVAEIKLHHVTGINGAALRHLNGSAVADGIDRRGERIGRSRGDVNAEHGGTRDHHHVDKTPVVKLQILIAIARSRYRIIGDIAALGGISGRPLRADGIHPDPLRLLVERHHLPNVIVRAVEFIRQVVMHLRRHAFFIDAHGG